MRFCLFTNLISSQNPFLPARKSTLIHFVTHLANSLSYGTIKVYLATVNKLHIEFGKQVCDVDTSYSLTSTFKKTTNLCKHQDYCCTHWQYFKERR